VALDGLSVKRRGVCELRCRKWICRAKMRRRKDGCMRLLAKRLVSWFGSIKMERRRLFEIRIRMHHLMGLEMRVGVVDLRLIWRKEVTLVV
jgi:hypothetical protein